MSPAQIASRLTNREASTVAMHALVALQSAAEGCDPKVALDALAKAVAPVSQRVTDDEG